MAIAKMILEYGTIFIEYFTWPIVCLTVFWWLRSPLINFINNIQSVSAGNVKVDTQRNQSNQNKPTETFASDAHLLGIVIEQKKIIRNELTKLKCKNKEEEINQLITKLAISQIEHSFEVIYYWIFYSQIEILKILNRNRDGIEIKSIEILFENFKQERPDTLQNVTFDQYLKFLFDTLLIIKNENMLKITTNGIEYLSWMERMGKLEKVYG